jgi:hypothetical protein
MATEAEEESEEAQREAIKESVLEKCGYALESA